MAARTVMQAKAAEVSGRKRVQRSFRWKVMASGVMIFVCTVLLYTPALKNHFVNLDDGAYVYENRHVHSLSLQSAHWMLTAFHAANWHPLTWLSHAVDCAFFDRNPLGHHLTSIILHGLNTLLVFLLSVYLVLKAHANKKASSFEPLPAPVFALASGWITALLFGVHPVHVESVVWIAERKDVLCAFFFLLTLLWYCFFVAAADKKKRAVRFTACLALAAAALMAKPMAVTLPLILLLLDIYPFKRFKSAADNRRVLLEKVPFLLLSAVAALLTVFAQHAEGAFESLERLPLHFRFVHALQAPLFYVIKMLWPVKLVPYYAFPQTIHMVNALYYGITVMLTLSTTAACIWQWRRGNDLFLISWAYYLITLFPVVGIIQVGSQAAADRYTYLPSISLFLLGGIGIIRLCAFPVRRTRGIIVGGLMGVVILFVFAQLTLRQITVWRDSETLWQYVIDTFPGRVPIAHNNLGVLYDGRGLHDKAIAEYEKAIAINPAFADAHNNLGVAHKRRGNYDKAIEAYEKALSNNPTFAEARNNLGLAYYAKGMDDKAIEAYEKALAINPAFAEAHYNMGLAYYAKGMDDKAIEAYEKALAINPAFAEAHYKLGLTHYENKHYALAKLHMGQAEQLGYEVDATVADLIKRAP